jgi:hypothetical protein
MSSIIKTKYEFHAGQSHGLYPKLFNFYYIHSYWPIFGACGTFGYSCPHFKMTVVFLIRHPKLNSISDD